MIIRTDYLGTVFSSLAYPPHSAAMERTITCGSEGNKNGKLIDMKLTAACLCLPADKQDPQVVLSGISTYSVLTDGGINVPELYSIYKHAMQLVIDKLAEDEKANGLTVTEGLEPLALETLSEELVALSMVFSH
ncbi:MAG TPA: hypothetical protein VK644_01275 [Chitinophagaceae bacterium]|nr:hypothetical protein [Chitinophagaceae bacterium]